MDIYNIRNTLKTKTIHDILMRVTFYARVSTDSDEQINSLGNQIGYYTQYIKKNKNWTYVQGYIDEGLSGITTKNRENFHKMIDDAEDGKFDLIITKEITRFARNTLDSIKYTRDLLSSGVAVFFQNDNINTLDEDSELRLTIMAGIAQDELRKLSSRVKFGHQQAIKNNVVFGNSRMFGYLKDNKRLIIDESECDMVKELFELYATGDYSMSQIEKIFWERGYRNRNGNKIAHTTMSGMISNPKYKGYYVGNKVRIVDIFTKKQKFLPPEEWVMFKDETGELVPAIVDEDIWEKANEVLLKRSRDVKKRQSLCNHANLLTGKLICTSCGTSYYRRDSKDKTGKKNSKWLCSGKIKNGAASCESFAIYESDIKPIIFDLFDGANDELESLMNKYIEHFKTISQSKNIEKQIRTLQTKITTSEKKKFKLLEYNVAGKLSDDDFISMNNQCDEELQGFKAQFLTLSAITDDKEKFMQKIKNLKKVITEAYKDASGGIVNKDFVDTYIDKIFVTPNGDKTMQLDFSLMTDKNISKYISNLGVRSGHTPKRMTPERTMNFNRKSRRNDGHIRKHTYKSRISIAGTLCS